MTCGTTHYPSGSSSSYSGAPPVIRRAAGRSEVPDGADEALASLAHEVFEAHQPARGGELGDLGYALGMVVVRIPSGRELTTKYATIWQRDADGRWRLAVDSSSPNPQARLDEPAAVP